MHGGIPFVGSLGTEIDRNLFGPAHVNVSWRQHSSVIHKARTHDHAETCNDPDRTTLFHSGGNQFESKVSSYTALGLSYPYSFPPRE